MENAAILENLGLDQVEAKAYLALTRLGGSKASVIAREIGIKRTTVYPILQTLAQRGFVNIYFRKNHRFYYAENPQKLMALFQNKLDAFVNVIPVLTMLGKHESTCVGLQFIETLDELKIFYNGILEEYKNKSYCVIGSATAWEGLDTSWFINFRERRGRARIKTRLLLTQESGAINPEDKNLLRHWKYLPAQYDFRSTIDIYDDKILIVSPALSSLAVVVAVPVMTDVFKSVFDLIWDMLPAV
ncbi:MAG: hypothetical protein A3J93_04845 [Candidatus Magasanikbacteria bacterium RIFOXYC2_FULL_42_28]|uniref:Transcription regulator TrmB N-terminal domain-containing protein n=1 Tax=Candidatus Magasanikbacteria bacterium RIFOXYC2_FULL_42_28 TaxID=1798704 RepID=A0A1F6NWN6_9BACT|nr:MAG: hypothetical protein A3J93_04845 [Candidatus Magasanikbacteria bacterium RIFOXYC2_FULL_42_28]